MYLFTIIAKPKPDNLDHKESGGAFVNAYIDFKEEEGAEVLARYFIEDSGWYAEETDEVSFLSKSDLEKDSEEYEFFQEAQENGSCLVFHSWPKDDDTETKH